MYINQLKTAVPDVRIDPRLNNYDTQVLFPEKMAKANEVLKKVGVPKPKSVTNKAR